MQSGYKLFWSESALEDLKKIIKYISEEWTQKEIKKFTRKLEKRLDLISSNPRLFPQTEKRKDIRRSVLTKHTVIYYQTNDTLVTIVTLFDSRQNPNKLKL